MRPSSRNRLTIAAATTLVVFSGISCIEDLINQNEDPVGDVPVTAEEVETYLRSNFTRIPLIADAFNRVVQTVGGNPQPGVAIVLTAAGGTGTVQMDMNSDGNSDATVDGGLTFSDPTQGLNGGASLAINSVASNAVSGSGSVQVVSAGTAAFTFTANGTSPTTSPVRFLLAPTSSFLSGSGTTMEIWGMGLTVEYAASPPFLSGFMNIRMIRGGVTIDADLIFESNGAGGWRIRVVDNDGVFPEFTIP